MIFVSHVAINSNASESPADLNALRLPWLPQSLISEHRVEHLRVVSERSIHAAIGS
jgi:hypothetical protein